MRLEFIRVHKDDELRCWIGKFLLTYNNKYFNIKFYTTGVGQTHFEEMVYEFSTLNNEIITIPYDKNMFDAIEIMAWDYMAPGIEAYQNAAG